MVHGGGHHHSDDSGGGWSGGGNDNSASCWDGHHNSSSSRHGSDHHHNHHHSQQYHHHSTINDSYDDYYRYNSIPSDSNNNYRHSTSRHTTYNHRTRGREEEKCCANMCLATWLVIAICFMASSFTADSSFSSITTNANFDQESSWTLSVGETVRIIPPIPAHQGAKQAFSIQSQTTNPGVEIYQSVRCPLLNGPMIRLVEKTENLVLDGDCFQYDFFRLNSG
jgi:hypothetical protein